jgi:3-deoxy-manno-octulosonate cytidylyltransferase (CMP-KDO synthetase)
MGKIIGIIPARWGSTRFPGKALTALAGKPLIQHVWQRCLGASKLDGVIVATDDLRIAEAAFSFGAEVAMTSSRHQSGTDRIAQVAARLGRGVSHVINIQGDEPTIAPALIDRLAVALQRDRDMQMVTAANLLRDPEEISDPNCVKVVLSRDGYAMYFSRSVIPHPLSPGTGAAAVTFHRHQGIYGYERKFLAQFVRWRPTPCERAERLEQLRALEHGVRIRVLVTEYLSLGVDVPEDVRRVEDLITAGYGENGST